MNFLSKAIQRGVGQHSLMLQQNSPKLLFVGGVAGMVGSTVLACRATLKLEEIVATTDNNLAVAKSIDDERYTEQDRKKDVAIIYVRAGGGIAKLYAPAVILGAASVAMLAKSHNLLEERNAALTAAYVALDKGFKEYRQRVVEKYGEEQDQEFRYDTELVTIKGEGNKKDKQELRVGPDGASIYARFFDEYSTSWSKDPESNRLFLKCQQNYLNDLLHARGHVFLNEAYEQVGLPHTSEGAIVGWVVGTEGDNYIDFGVWDPQGGESIRHFVNGREGSVLLDFNVDGVIFDKINGRLSWQLDQK